MEILFNRNSKSKRILSVIYTCPDWCAVIFYNLCESSMFPELPTMTMFKLKRLVISSKSVVWTLKNQPDLVANKEIFAI